MKFLKFRNEISEIKKRRYADQQHHGDADGPYNYHVVRQNSGGRHKTMDTRYFGKENNNSVHSRNTPSPPTPPPPPPPMCSARDEYMMRDKLKKTTPV